MNTKGNQRAIQTEKKIKGVFLKLLNQEPLSKISVSEICKQANIHRTTFYVHYQDVQDLMEHMVEEMYAQVMEFFLQKDGRENGDGFEHLFEMIQEQQEFFSAYLEASRNTKREYQLIPDLLEERAEQLYRLMGFASREELYYHQTFFSAGLSAIIRRWILGGCVESPKDLSRILREEYTADKSYFWNQENRE